MKTFSIFSFISIYTAIVFGQAAIDIPIIVHDTTGLSWTLNFGLDLTATDGIDTHLGEFDLPPGPPTNDFDARWWLPPFAGELSTFSDYRAPGNPPAFPFTGIIQYVVKFQTTDWPITINWDLPLGIAHSSRITDMFGGMIINKVFAGRDSLIISDPNINQLSIFVHYDGDPNVQSFYISPSELNFPQNIIGSNTTLSAAVINYGLTDTLIITNIVSFNEYFTIAPNAFPIYIAPLDSQIFQVTNEAAIDLQQGTIEFTHNAPGSPSIFNVSAPPGFQPGPVFVMSTTSLEFPQMPEGTVDTLSVTISNNGFLNTLYIDTIRTTSSYFDIFPNSVPIAIEPLSSKNFIVTYTSAYTLQQGIIEFTHNAPGSPAVLNVSSSYSPPQFSIYPASLYFNSQPLSKNIWLENTDTYDTLIINNISSSNSNYTITPDSFPISIFPGSTTIFHIELNNSPGFQIGTVEINHTAIGSPYLLNVSNQLLEPMVNGLIVVSSGSVNRELRFGFDTLATDGIDEYFGEYGPLPPLPPPGAFEAQFYLPQDNFIGSLSAYSDFRFAAHPSSGQKEWRLVYQPLFGGGITIGWNLPSSITGFIQDLVNGTFINIPISYSGSFIVSDPLIFNKLRILIDFDINIATTVEISPPVDIPLVYSIAQNYPNPFNPSTVIKFSLPEAANVKLTIYNSLGQKVDEIVNTTLEAGYHSYDWDAGSAASGIYFYELRTENFIATKKMILLK